MSSTESTSDDGMDEQTCPRGCDAPVLTRFTTHDPFQIKHANAVQDKTCVVPQSTEEGPAVTVVFHDVPPEVVEQAQDGDEAVRSAEADPGFPTDDTEEQLYHRINRETSMTLAKIKGFANGNLGLNPNQTKAMVKKMVEEGYLDEIENGIYQVPE